MLLPRLPDHSPTWYRFDSALRVTPALMKVAREFEEVIIDNVSETTFSTDKNDRIQCGLACAYFEMMYPVNRVNMREQIFSFAEEPKVRVRVCAKRCHEMPDRQHEASLSRTVAEKAGFDIAHFFRVEYPREWKNLKRDYIHSQQYYCWDKYTVWDCGSLSLQEYMCHPNLMRNKRGDPAPNMKGGVYPADCFNIYYKYLRPAILPQGFVAAGFVEIGEASSLVTA